MRRLIITIILTIAAVWGLKDFYYVPLRSVDASLFERFDCKVFIIISVCLFMIIYRVVQYLGVLKIIENHSRIDIVFMFFVVLFMFVPMSKMDDSDISRRENRVLDRYEPFINGDKINFEYGKDFEEWFNDRFRYRDYFINANNRINRFINGKTVSDKAMVGEQGWLFSKQYNAVAMFQNDNLFLEEELAKISENIKKFDEWSKKRGAKFYLYVVPDKETIYGEFYPKNYGKVHDVSRIEQTVKYLRENTSVPIIYPYNELMAAKNDDVIYYKTGTHWNEIGAYVGYRNLFETIKKDFPTLRIMSKSDFYIGKKRYADVDIANLLAIDAYKDYSDADMLNVYYEVRNPRCKMETVDYKDKDKGFLYSFDCDNKRNGLTAFFYTDSFFLSSNKYVAESFRHVDHIFMGFGKDFVTTGENGDALRNSDADIIVIETTERFLPRLLRLDIPEEK